MHEGSEHLPSQFLLSEQRSSGLGSVCHYATRIPHAYMAVCEQLHAAAIGCIMRIIWDLSSFVCMACFVQSWMALSLLRFRVCVLLVLR